MDQVSNASRPHGGEAADTSWRSLTVSAAEALRAAGVPSPRHDADMLAAHVLGASRASLYTASAPTPQQREEFALLVGRRASREPLQHLTGRAYFRHVELEVGPGVFVPRPETELVAGVAIDEARRVRAASGNPARVVDLCTGSGAIAASVADEIEDVVVHAVELSPDAHAYAARNLAGTGVDLRCGDAATAFADLDGTVDVVVTNPPYVPLDAVIRDPEVAEHDPALALWGGPDGLDVVRQVVAVGARLLRDGGLLVVEHADVQGVSVPALLDASVGERAGWRDVSDHPDLLGRDRYCTARRARVARPSESAR